MNGDHARKNGIAVPQRRAARTITDDHCDFCNANLRYQIDGKSYTRIIGVTDLFRDRIGWWRCPDCGAEVER